MVSQGRRRPKRGEIWLVALDPTLGSEIQKTRPCVVVSPPDLNAHLRVVLVVPLTSGSRPAPFRIPTQFAGKEGLMLLEQTRCVDVVRLVKRVGDLDQSTLEAALRGLRALFSE